MGTGWAFRNLSPGAALTSAWQQLRPWGRTAGGVTFCRQCSVVGELGKMRGSERGACASHLGTVAMLGLTLSWARRLPGHQLEPRPGLTVLGAGVRFAQGTQRELQWVERGTGIASQDAGCKGLLRNRHHPGECPPGSTDCQAHSLHLHYSALSLLPPA